MIGSVLVPFIVCVIGALVYALSNNGKVAALGKDAFWCGLLVTLYVVSGHKLSF